MIDDVLSLDHPEFKGYVDSVAPDDLTGEVVGGIYPQQLRIACTNVSTPKNAQFLGMDVRDEGGRLVLDVYDKRRGFDFTVVRYPHMDSVIPRNIPYGVFTGLLFRRYRICTEVEAFVNNAVDVACTLWRQGCVKARLRQLFYRFLVRHSPLRWKTPMGSIVRQFACGVGNFERNRDVHA